MMHPDPRKAWRLHPHPSQTLSYGFPPLDCSRGVYFIIKLQYYVQQLSANPVSCSRKLLHLVKYGNTQCFIPLVRSAGGPGMWSWCLSDGSIVKDFALNLGPRYRQVMSMQWNCRLLGVRELSVRPGSQIAKHFLVIRHSLPGLENKSSSKLY